MKNTTREKTYCMPGITAPLPLLGQVIYKVIIIPISQIRSPGPRATFQRCPLLCVWFVLGKIGKAFGLKN